MIKTELERLDRNDTASGYGALNSSKLLQDTRGVIDVDLRFDMKHYVSIFFFLYIVSISILLKVFVFSSNFWRN